VVIGAVFGGTIIWTALAQEIGSRQLPFSRAREAGDTLYLSGQIARTPDGVDVRDSVAAETRQTMENLGATLEEHGYTWSDVVNVTVYLKDLADYAEMNDAYAEFFDGRYPARACVGGVDIVFDHRVEISAIAHRAD
jgi:reactive intermediate/imine deaminase